MKKRIAAVLLAASLVLSASGACAQSLPCAAQSVSPRALERYAGFAQEGDAWRAHGVLADAALYYLSQRAGEFAYNGASLFYLELGGSEQLGLLVPRLVLYYVNNTRIEATAISLAFDGVRYDLQTACEEVSIGGRKAEKLTAFLDAEGLQMLRDMQQAQEVELRIHGRGSVYTTAIERDETSTQSKKKLESASLSASQDMLAELTTLNIDGYQLWDKSRAAFEQQYGECCRMTATALAKDESEYRLDDSFNQLVNGDTGNGVKALQKLLIDKGFMMGTADQAYGDTTSLAVRRAQQYYRLMPTGSCDHALLACLMTDEAPIEVSGGAAAERMTAEGLCELSLERFYLAGAVAASAQPLTVARSVTNRDNRLVVVEGSIQSLCAGEMNLYWQLTGALCAGAYEYPIEVMCESNRGENLDSTLLPLAKSRLIVLSEVPMSALEQAEDWTLKLNLKDETIEYPLNMKE